MVHWPTSWTYFMLGTVGTRSKTARPRELNAHILQSGWNKREELGGQEKEGSKYSMRHTIPSQSCDTAFYNLSGQSHIDHFHWLFQTFSIKVLEWCVILAGVKHKGPLKSFHSPHLVWVSNRQALRQCSILPSEHQGKVLGIIYVLFLCADTW